MRENTKALKKILQILPVAAGLVLMLSIAKDNVGAFSFVEVRSEHYVLKPDYQFYWYELLDGSEEKLIGAVDFYSPLIVEKTDGERLLMTRYLDTSAFVPISIDEELQRDLEAAIGVDAKIAEPFDDFEEKTDENTGLSYIVKKKGYAADRHVLLYDEADIAVFRELSQEYADSYPVLAYDESVGAIYAELEIEGHAKRYEDGFFFYQPGSINYIDIKDNDAYWSLTLNYNEYCALSDYLNDGLPDFDLRDFELWKTIFDVVGIEYDVEFDPESPRYQAALEQIESFAPTGKVIELSESGMKNLMKEFDEDGDYLGPLGIAGMNATKIKAEERMVIIDVPEKFLRKIFEHEKAALLTGYVLYDNADEKTDIYLSYQQSVPKEERLKGTYTLQQYERVYRKLLLAAVTSRDRGWEPGEDFEDNLLKTVTFEYAMSRILSDGRSLRLDIDLGIREELSEAESQMVEWTMK